MASGNSAVRVPSPGLGPDSPQGEWLDVGNIEGNELDGVTPKLVSVLRSSKRH